MRWGFFLGEHAVVNLDDTKFLITCALDAIKRGEANAALQLLEDALASLDPSYNEADPPLPNPAIVADCGIDVDYERTARTMLE